MPPNTESVSPESLIGFSLSRVGTKIDSLRGNILSGSLSKVAEKPRGFGEDFDEKVEKEYLDLIKLAADSTPDERRVSLDKLLSWAKNDKREAINFDDPKTKKMFAESLRGIEEFAQEMLDNPNALITDPNMIGKLTREKQMQVVLSEIAEKFGLEGDFNREDLLRLMGDLIAISPEEMGSLAFWAEKNTAFLNGRLSDEMWPLLKAFGQEGTSTAVTMMSELSTMTFDQQKEVMTKMKPLEMFCVAHVPFVVRMADGNERHVTIAQVSEFLISKKGRQYFRNPPLNSVKYGLSPFIGWLEETYPDAGSGINLTSGLNIASAKAGERFVPSKILDGGRLGLDEIDKPYVRMAETTWGNLFKTAVGFVNTLWNRGEIYRGAVANSDSELQKGANMYYLWLEYYKNESAELRLMWPRFGSLAERMSTPDPLKWFNKLDDSNEQPDFNNPFNPEPWANRNGGIEIDANGLSEKDKVMLNFKLVCLFYGFEETPGLGTIDETVMSLVSHAYGKTFDERGEVRGVEKLSRKELLKMAYELEKKNRGELFKFIRDDDLKLDLLFNYRSFYPLSKDVILRRLEVLESSGADSNWKQGEIDRIDFSGLVRRLGGVVNPGTNFKGIEGAKAVVEAMGEGLWKKQAWGTRPKNDPKKHAGYEAQMAELYQAIKGMWIESTQSRDSELMEKVGEDLVGSKHGLDEAVVKSMNKIRAALAGVGADAKLRTESVSKFLENYLKFVKGCGFMSGARGIWWIYEAGCTIADYMCELDEVPKYLASGRQSIDTERGKVHRPVTNNIGIATYKELYSKKLELGEIENNRDLVDALAVVGIDVDAGEPFYSARASGIHPVAMVIDGARVVRVDRTSSAGWFGHERQVPFQSKKTANHEIKEALRGLIKDARVLPEQEVDNYLKN